MPSWPLRGPRAARLVAEDPTRSVDDGIPTEDRGNEGVRDGGGDRRDVSVFDGNTLMTYGFLIRASFRDDAE